MNHRAPKQRSVCRYYSPDNNSCYYGDACQFQHAPTADHHPAQMAPYGMVQQQPIMGPIMPNRAVDPATMRSHSSGVPPPGVMVPVQPSGIRGMGRGSLPPQALKKQHQDLRHGNMPPAHRMSGYKGSLVHHASNPPKRRMGSPAVVGGAMGGASMQMHMAGKPHPGMLRNQPPRKEREQAKMGGGRNWKKEDGRSSQQSDRSKDEESSSDCGDREGSEKKIKEGGRNETDVKAAEGGVKKGLTQEDVRRSASEGTGMTESSGRVEFSGKVEEVGRSASSGYSFTTLQPPPASKLSKNKGSHTPSSRSQVQSGGTTYFYSGQQPSYAPDFTVYSGPMPQGPGSSSKNSSSTSSSSMTSSQASFFLSDNLRQELQQQQLACLSMPVSDTSCPREVDKYHSLCPLEPVDAAPDQEAKHVFGHPSTCYRGICQKDGLFYCLRRIHGFRLTSPKAVQELDKWKQLAHVNLVVLKEMFTTKAFGDHSVVFVYEFHPAAMTLREKHSRHTKRPSALPEDLVWEYVVQLASAVRMVHSQKLALRCLDPNKVLVSSRQRLRVSGCGIMDVITYDSSSATSESPAMHQQGDLYSLGQLLVSVSLQSVEAARPDLLHRSMEAFASIYSPDLNHLVQYLLQSGSKTPPHSIMDVLSMVGGQMQFSLERSLLRADLLEQELSKELQNGRLFRVLAKLGTINERPEFANDEQWAETGDRYLLKLLRDYLFHQVHPSGAPWINLAHVVQTLNKIDAGTFENIALHSRDEKSVLVVSYADLKLCLENSFSELLSASSNHSGTAVGRGVNGHTL